MFKTGIAFGLMFLSVLAAQANDGCPLFMSERLFRDYDVSWKAENEIKVTRKSPPFFYSNQNKWRDYWSTSITVAFDTDFSNDLIPAGTKFELQMDPIFPEYDGFFRPSMMFYLREIIKEDPASSETLYVHQHSASVRVLHLKNVGVKKFEKLTGLTLTCKRRN